MNTPIFHPLLQEGAGGGPPVGAVRERPGADGRQGFPRSRGKCPKDKGGRDEPKKERQQRRRGMPAEAGKTPKQQNPKIHPIPKIPVQTKGAPIENATDLYLIPITTTHR